MSDKDCPICGVASAHGTAPPDVGMLIAQGFALGHFAGKARQEPTRGICPEHALAIKVTQAAVGVLYEHVKGKPLQPSSDPGAKT